MKKSEQLAINELINNEVEKANNEVDAIEYVCRLRTCNAHVYETRNYYFLLSYHTLIAFIDKNTDTLYDVLRLVYGYTSTSAQHIAKFRKDFGNGKWGCEHEYTYRVV